MGESCLHSKGNFTLQRIGCVSVLTVKDKGLNNLYYIYIILYIIYLSPFTVFNPRSHFWAGGISAVYVHLCFWKLIVFHMILSIKKQVIIREDNYPFHILPTLLSVKYRGCPICNKKNVQEGLSVGICSVSLDVWWNG